MAVKQQKLNIDQRRGGFYWLGEPPKPYVSVTTVLGETLRKPGLEHWQMEQVYWAMVKDPTIDKAKALAAPGIVSDQAKDRGSTVHSIVEAYKHTGEYIESVPEKFAGYAKAFYSFLNDVGYKIREHERTVVSTRYGYAGTCDLILEGGRVVLVDVKTGKRVYDDHFYQLSAYKQALGEMGLTVNAISVLLLREDGSYSFDERPSELEVFLGLLTAWRSRNRELLLQLGGGEKNG